MGRRSLFDVYYLVDTAYQLLDVFAVVRVAIFIFVLEQLVGRPRAGEYDRLGKPWDRSALDFYRHSVAVCNAQQEVEGTVRLAEIVKNSHRLPVVPVKPSEVSSTKPIVLLCLLSKFYSFSGLATASVAPEP